MPKYLTIYEAAEISRCSSFTVRRALKSGVLPFMRGTNQRLLVPELEVLAWFASGCPSGPKPTAPEGAPSAVRASRGAA